MKTNLQLSIGEIEKANTRTTCEDSGDILQEMEITTPDKVKNGKLVARAGWFSINYYR
jgi:hypothetical protein